MKKIKLLLTLLINWLIKAVFTVFSAFFSVNPRKVTFASSRARVLQGNLLYVHDELIKQEKDYEIACLLNTYKSSARGKFIYLLEIIKNCYHLATSRYFFIDDYFYPVYVINPRRETEIIQLWHAAGAFKKFGYSTVGKPFGPSEAYLKIVKVHSNYSYAIVSSNEVVPHYAEAFNMPAKKILPLGLPRTDYFYSTREHKTLKKNFYIRHPELKNKKMILYAPTYRGKSNTGKAFTIPFHVDEMKRILGEDFYLVAHFHPYNRNDLKEQTQKASGFLYNFSEEFNIDELMILSDMLITDYSSVVFDYSLLNKPVGFYSYDLEEYENERDFYFDYREFIPGPMFEDTVSMSDWIKQENKNLKQITEFRDRFFDHHDGESSKRVIDHFFN